MLYLIHKKCVIAHIGVVIVLENVIGVEEASELWGLSAGYIKNLCAEGKIKSKKIGNTWIIDKTQENPSKLKK
jgi:excisionase family DNA binding protein